MKTKQALIKLASLRLAINHILRTRLTKQADVRPELVNPGDYNYNPYQGYNLESHNFEPYDANSHYRFSEKFGPKITMQDLIPYQVSTNKNPYLHAKPYRPERLSELLHRKLFGFPVHKLNLDLDADTAMENRTKAIQSAIIPSHYERQQAYREHSKLLGDLFQRNFGTKSVSKDTPFLNIGKVNQFSRNLPVYFMDLFGNPVEVPIPLDRGEAWDFTKNQRRIYNAEKDFRQNSLNVEDRLGEHPLHWKSNPEDWWNKNRSKLMHFYIDQSPIGMAHKLFPSMVTGAPYAVYHALPFLWKENIPGELQRMGINLPK